MRCEPIRLHPFARFSRLLLLGALVGGLALPAETEAQGRRAADAEASENAENGNGEGEKKDELLNSGTFSAFKFRNLGPALVSGRVYAQYVGINIGERGKIGELERLGSNRPTLIT